MSKQLSRVVGQLYTATDGTTAVSRRGLLRYPVRPGQSLTILVRPGLIKLQVILDNVGVNGLAFLSERPLVLGSVLALQLDGLGRKGSWVRSGKILHCTSHGEMGYLVGVEITPFFSPDELEQLIDPLSRA